MFLKQLSMIAILLIIQRWINVLSLSMSLCNKHSFWIKLYSIFNKLYFYYVKFIIENMMRSHLSKQTLNNATNFIVIVLSTQFF